MLSFSYSVMSDSLQPHGLQHTRLPCPSTPPGVCSNSHALIWWLHPIISSSVVPFSSCLHSFPASVFSRYSALHIKWPKYWNFSFRGHLESSLCHCALKFQNNVWFELGRAGIKVCWKVLKSSTWHKDTEVEINKECLEDLRISFQTQPFH